MRKLLTLAAMAAVLPLLGASSSSAAIATDLYSPSNYDKASSFTETATVTAILDTYNSTNTLSVQDGTGSVIIYEIPTSTYAAPAVGDTITYTMTNSPYQGSPELKGSTVSGFSLVSSGNSAPVPVLTIPQFNAAGNGSTAKQAVAPYAEAIVTLDNVYLPAGTTSLANKTTYTITDLPAGLGNSATLYTYGTYADVLAADNAANSAETASANTFFAGPLNITGYVDVYNGVPELYPLSFTSAVAIPEPASLGLLGVGALSLLARRRCRA